MPTPESPDALQKTAISEKGREQLIAGLKEVARGLRLFERAREQAELVPKQDIFDKDSPMSALAIAQAEAGLFALALKTHPPLKSPNDSATLRIVDVMAGYGYGRQALPLVEQMAPAAKGTKAESDWLLKRLRAIADAQQQAGESTERARALMLQIIVNGREHFTSHKNRVDWCIQDGLVDEASQFLDEIKDPAEREAFSIRIAVAQYVRKPNTSVLKSLVAAMKRSSNAQHIESVVRDTLDQLAEVGDTSAIRAVEDAILYSGWFSRLVGDSDQNQHLTHTFYVSQMLAHAHRSDRSRAREMADGLLKPREKFLTLVRMARIELGQGNLDAALAVCPTVDDLARDASSPKTDLLVELQQFHRECVSVALGQKNFSLALKLIHDSSWGEPKRDLLKQYAIAFGQSGGDIEGELLQLRDTHWINQPVKYNRMDVLDVYLTIGRFKDAETLIGQLNDMGNQELYTHRLALAFLAHDQLEPATRLLRNMHSTSTRFRDNVLVGIAEFHAEHGEQDHIFTAVDMMSTPEVKCHALANAGKIFVHKGLAPEEIYEMTIGQAKAVVLGGDTEAIGVLKTLRPDLIKRLDKSPDIKK